MPRSLVPVWSVIVISAGVFALVSGLRRWWWNRRLRASGASVRGKAVDVLVEGVSSLGTGSRSICRSLIEFDAGEKGIVTFWTDTHYNRPPYAVGTEVTVLYDPANPQSAEAASESQFNFDLILGITMIVSGVLLLVL